MPRHKPASASRHPVIVWFRDDLRLSDHPALSGAASTGQPLLLLYLLDEQSPGSRQLGGASKWWLAHSLGALSAEIRRQGAVLHLFRGAAEDVIPLVAEESGATAVFWSRRYGLAETTIDEAVAARLAGSGIEVRGFNGSLGYEPEEIRPKAGGWYRVYMAYWRARQAATALASPLPAPSHLEDACYKPKRVPPCRIEDFELLPHHPDWSQGLAETWAPGEASAQRKLAAFAGSGSDAYAESRDKPAIEGSSQLSPHLRFGEISPRQIVASVKASARTRHAEGKTAKFLQEVAWRDFAYSLLFHVPDLATAPFDPKFRAFHPPAVAREHLRAWQRGRTGYPIVDAGMRQLWRTGWMHNRVRMVTASFLIKHLLADWRVGEAWFWDTLCDADPANNAVNWQWVAGSGPDAAPFFRIFNPVLQGEKFDPDGSYVGRFVPELAGLPARWIHKPWEAPADTLAEAGVVLGETYPKPIVDHAAARQRALAAFSALSESSTAAGTP